MLRGDREPKQLSFADQARAMRAVPDDHLLMQMKRRGLGRGRCRAGALNRKT